MYPYLTIGSFQLPMYGLCILIGATLAVVLTMRRAKRTSVHPDDVLYSIVYTAIGAILGGKALYVITSWNAIKENADYYFTSFEGFREFFSYGFVFYGGLIVGLAVFIFYAVRHKLNLSDMINLIIPVVPLTHALGRVGCFCAGCCYGVPMDPPWGLYFNSPLSPHGVPLFPVQLLESALNLILFAVLFTYARKPRKPGAVLGLYLSCYGVERFLLEFLRFDQIRGFLFGVSTSQWISILLIPLGLFLIFAKIEKKLGISELAGPDAHAAQDDAQDASEEAQVQEETTQEETVQENASAEETPCDDASTQDAPRQEESSAGEETRKEDAPQA